MTALQLYQEKNLYMNRFYTELTPLEFYTEVFRPDSLEVKGDPSFRASNPVFSYLEKKDGRTYFRNEILFRDMFAQSLKKAEKNELALCSMCSFVGRKKSAKNAFKCHGFCIDLDGVGMRELESFWGWVEHLEKIPYPSYVANSGHGLHIYYLFENPVPLYPQVAQHLQQLKRGLTMWVWNRETSSYKPQDRQFQGIYQSFRMPGSCTKLGKGNARKKYPVRVWRTGKPVTLSYLNQFVSDEFKVPENPDYSSWEWADDHHTLEECRKLYPDWYEKRIIKGEPSGQWKCNRGLYDWWLAKIQEGKNARDGNRYHCISMLYVYAAKCMLDKALVDADAMDLLEPFNALTIHEDNDFTESDIYSASSFYDPMYVKMTRKEISRRTGIEIEKNKRNGRKQEVHVKYMNNQRAFKVEMGECTNGGRPDKEQIVREWQRSHPDGRKIDCERETGLSRHTILKWWRA